MDLAQIISECFPRVEEFHLNRPLKIPAVHALEKFQALCRQLEQLHKPDESLVQTIQRIEEATHNLIKPRGFCNDKREKDLINIHSSTLHAGVAASEIGLPRQALCQSEVSFLKDEYTDKVFQLHQINPAVLLKSIVQKYAFELLAALQTHIVDHESLDSQEHHEALTALNSLSETPLIKDLSTLLILESSYFSQNEVKTLIFRAKQCEANPNYLHNLTRKQAAHISSLQIFGHRSLNENCKKEGIVRQNLNPDKVRGFYTEIFRNHNSFDYALSTLLMIYLLTAYERTNEEGERKRIVESVTTLMLSDPDIFLANAKDPFMYLQEINNRKDTVNFISTVAPSDLPESVKERYRSLLQGNANKLALDIKRYMSHMLESESVGYCPINLNIPFIGVVPKSLILDRIINPGKPHFSFETLFEFIPASSENAKAVLDWVGRLVRISRHENEQSGKEINKKHYNPALEELTPITKDFDFLQSSAVKKLIANLETFG